jgi:hypothetical protein
MITCCVFTSFSLLAITAQASDSREAIAALEAKLMKLGEPKLMGTEKAGDLMVPGIYYGSRKINNNYDIVDAIKRETGATATVFVKHGDEFVRVSTNVLTKDDKRGVGTLLARNQVYSAVIKGEKYCGSADVLGTAFDTCYYPIKNAAAKVIGLTYIGYKK